MAWLVETLLKNRVAIRTEPDINSDSFNDLLVLEIKLEKLKKDNLLSKEELEIIDFVSDGTPISESKDILGKHRVVISKKFIDVCNKIAYLLGGEFTDDGYLEMMKRKYNLNESQLEILKEYMEGSYKHKLLKNPVQKELKNNE